MSLGDITVTVVVDCCPNLQGFESTLAGSLNGIIKSSPTGTCDLRVLRAGVDDAPKPMLHVEASHFLACSKPGDWIKPFVGVHSGTRHIVIAALYSEEICANIQRLRHMERRNGVHRLTVGCGMLPERFELIAGVSMSYAILSTPAQHKKAWDAVIGNIAAVRCIPRDDDPRIQHKLAFQLEQKAAAFPIVDRQGAALFRSAHYWNHYRLAEAQKRIKQLLGPQDIEKGFAV